jgi:CubicO group peptidase (beta-lactamase class C family)
MIDKSIRFHKIFIMLIVLSLLSPQLIQARDTDEFLTFNSNDGFGTIDDNFDQSVHDLMNGAHLPSLAIGIIKNDKLVWSQGYGFSNILGKKHPTEHTVYMLASISKTFTTTAIMQLWEKGLFDLDDDVNKYLPFSVRNPNYPDVPITFRMLLSHRSSISGNNVRLFTYFSLMHYPYSYLEEYLTPSGSLYSPRNWRNEMPGESQTYSSTGIELLGYLVECITGQPFTEYCTDHILHPLEMNNSSYHLDDFETNELAVQYVYLFSRYIPLPYFEDKNYASGGLRSTVSDLSHYLISFMNGGVYKNARILNNETIDLMFTLQYNDSRFPGFGLGWQIFWGHGNNSTTRIGHNGGMPGSLTYMFYHVERDAGVIILSNQHLYYRIQEMMNWFSIIGLVSQKIDNL